MSVSAAATILAACVSAAAVVFAAWLANSLQRQLKRQLKQGVQEQQLKAYEGLWAATEKAAAVREKGDWAGGPLSEKERGELFHEITKWYYGKAGGIYLAPKTRCIYLRVKENLVCPETDIEPKGALDELSREFPDVRNTDERRSLLGLRQLSLLRWVMRFDLDIPTEPYFRTFTPMERQLLKDCEIELDKPPFIGKWEVKPTKRPGM